MRKILVSTSVSLDGYFEGPGHDLSWHRVDEELHAYFNDSLGEMSTFLDGRVTHELMASVWPTIGEDPDAHPLMVEFGRIWCEKPKILFSRTLDDPRWNTTVRREVDPEEMRALTAQPGGDMVVGGADLVDTFRRLDLIDEYRIFVHPVVVGAGTPFFKQADVLTALELLETRTFGNGVVLLRYGRSRAGSAAAD
jgi:dihydrofolate reductase